MPAPAEVWHDGDYVNGSKDRTGIDRNLTVM
jgi:hypothetical protein